MVLLCYMYIFVSVSPWQCWRCSREWCCYWRARSPNQSQRPCCWASWWCRQYDVARCPAPPHTVAWTPPTAAKPHPTRCAALLHLGILVLNKHLTWSVWMVRVNGTAHPKIKILSWFNCTYIMEIVWVSILCNYKGEENNLFFWVESF